MVCILSIPVIYPTPLSSHCPSSLLTCFSASCPARHHFLILMRILSQRGRWDLSVIIVLVCCLSGSCRITCEPWEWLIPLCFFFQTSSFSTSPSDIALSVFSALPMESWFSKAWFLPADSSGDEWITCFPYDLVQQIFSSECLLHLQKTPSLIVTLYIWIPGW